LNAPLPDSAVVMRQIAAALFPSMERLPAPLAHRVSAALEEVAGPLLEQFRSIVRAEVTEELMTLALPDGTLHLGRDLTGRFPPHLMALADRDLVAFLDAVDPTPNTLHGSGANGWANLAERMHFIADLFRLQHESAALFQAPFTPDQLRFIAAGRIPDGSL
jgi:hypothetical protein